MAAVPRCSWSEGRLLYVTGSCCWPSPRTVRASCNRQPAAGGRRGQRGVRLPDRRRRHSPACCASHAGLCLLRPARVPPQWLRGGPPRSVPPGTECGSEVQQWGTPLRFARARHASVVPRAPSGARRGAPRQPPTNRLAILQRPGAHPRGSICQAAARVAPSRESARASKCTVRFRFRRRTSHCSETRCHKLFCENVRSSARCRCAATKRAPGWLHAADAHLPQETSLRRGRPVR